MVEFGYNRDGKRSHEQVVIGLITTDEGCPICVEVFPGNCFAPPHGAHPFGAAYRLATSSLGSNDASTVAAKVTDLRKLYGVKDIVFVGDRGMVTASNEEKLKALPDGDGIKK